MKLEEHILIVLFKIWSTTKRYYKFNIKVFNINILKTEQTIIIIMVGQPFGYCNKIVMETTVAFGSQL